jgi:hypothetical protein
VERSAHLLLLAALVFGAAQARAEEPEPPAPRPVPDYDGRGEEPTTASEVALWVPRVLLSPLYLVSEYVVRRPVGWLVTALERERVPEALLSFFQFGPNDEIAIVPTALIDLGFKPSVGVYARWNDFLTPGHKLRLHFATWGPDWLRLTLADRYEWNDENNRLQLRGELTRRPDALHYGIGLDNDEHNESRYKYQFLEAELSFESEFWRASSFRAAARVRTMSFSSRGACCDEPPIGVRVDEGTLRDRAGEPLGLPPGFAGYDLYAQGVQLVVDSRRERPHPGSGVRVGFDSEHAFDLQDPLARRWLRYGATAGAFLDLTGQDRVLSLSILAMMIRPIAGEVPFTELVDLGDLGPLQGFVEGWVIGQSAAAARLEYAWPVWVWLDATVHLAIGNAFGRDFAGFDLAEGRLSTGIGVRTVDERDHGFMMLLAFGSDTLREGAEFESVRFVFGGTRVF